MYRDGWFVQQCRDDRRMKIGMRSASRDHEMAWTGREVNVPEPRVMAISYHAQWRTP
jgi:hypothetical protein